jgi:hypothetical protein
MKHVLLATTVLVTATFAAGTATGAVTNAAGGCYAKSATIKGKSVIVACGPASAKLRYKGKTYSFKSGTCFREGTAVTLELGTSLASGADGNGGFTDFSLQLLLVRTHIAQVGADQGKLHLTGAGTYSKIAVTGTFKGTAGSGGAKIVPFTGSWNCGGAIYKQ